MKREIVYLDGDPDHCSLCGSRYGRERCTCPAHVYHTFTCACASRQRRRAAMVARGGTCAACAERGCSADAARCGGRP